MWRLYSLSKVDLIYNNLIKEIHEDGVWDKGEQVRTKYIDGTPAYTKSIFGKQIVFEEGEIPILTTKFVGSKTALKEMMLFWIHQTVKKEDFDAWNVRVWDEWFLGDNTLGKSYAYQFESRPHKIPVKVKVRKKERHPDKLPNIVIENLIQPTPNPHLNAKYIGNIYNTKDYGNYIVLDSYIKEPYPNPRVLIQFLDTGFIKETDIASVMHKKNIKDNYKRYYFGVGYIGNIERFKHTLGEELTDKLYRKWYYMLERCYKINSREYKNYGAKGIFVDERWHSLENYLADIIYLPNYFIAKQSNFKEYDLDKDYFNANYYGKDSCVWLESGENLMYRNNPISINLIKPNGTKEFFLSIGDAERKYNLTNLNKIPKGQREHVRGYKIEYYSDLKEDEVYRYKLSKNQVVDLINNIKSNPSSRRHMSSFWNDADVNEKALQECAMQTTWNVREGKLDLLLYSRSVDSALGLPYNWIQYWFLLQMISQATGLKAGRFIHQMGSVHYYDRHEETLLKQIRGEYHEQPSFWINPEVKDFFQFTPNDIKIENYNHNGKFTYEVAV
jgi:thymidylate synthase